MTKQLRYRLEALLLYTITIVFKFMPADAASNIGGLIGRKIGPKLAASRKAVQNLKDTLPDITAPDTVIENMWDNLGRIMAEYAHLETIGKTRVKIEGVEHIKALKDGQPAVFIGAHIGNWEVITAAFWHQLDTALDITYRAPNNPWSDALLLKTRALNGKIRAYPKSREGGMATYRALKAGRRVIILIDQKYNPGEQVNFLGRAAMTNPVFVQLAQKMDCPLIPVQIERTDPDSGAHFICTIHPPIRTKDAEGAPLETTAVIRAAHDKLEEWVKHAPGQWLWLHRRWG